MGLGTNIKSKRKQLKLLQSELCDKFNIEFKNYATIKNIPVKRIDKRTISNWENDISSPNVEYIPVLCKILNTDANELFNIEGDNKFTKKILIENDNTVSIYTNEPWENLSDQEKKNLMDSIIEESIKLKKENK